MQLSPEDKITVLLNRLDAHTSEIQRREEKESKLFEWATTVLLTVFAVVVALSDKLTSMPYQIFVKITASLLLIIPIVIFIIRILSERKSMYRQAIVVEHIEKDLHFFEDGYYVKDISLFPDKWKGSFPDAMLKRKTPIFYSAILVVMLLGVITTIWLIL